MMNHKTTLEIDKKTKFWQKLIVALDYLKLLSAFHLLLKNDEKVFYTQTNAYLTLLNWFRTLDLLFCPAVLVRYIPGITHSYLGIDANESIYKQHVISNNSVFLKTKITGKVQTKQDLKIAVNHIVFNNILPNKY